MKNYEILGLIIETYDYYNPDPGNPMSNDIESKKESVELYYNEQKYATRILKLKQQKKKFKCFKGNFITTPEISIQINTNI